MKKRSFFRAALSLLTASCLFTSCATAGFSGKSVSLTEGLDVREVAGKPADKAFCDAQTAFSVALLKQVLANENVLVSPTSAALALTMTANGAANETKAEMERVLGQGLTLDDLNAYFNTVYVKGLLSDKTLHVADSVWFRDGLTLKEAFLQKNKDYFDAALYQSAFDKSTVNDINAWVKKNTNGMIEKLLDDLKPDEMVHLINAVAFEGEWAEKFDYTAEATFTSQSGQTQTAQMMSSTENLYLSGNGATGFMKPYKGGKYAFAALLPNDGTTANDYVSSLTAGELSSLLASAKSERVSVSMPKFSYDYKTDLSDAMKAMGMSSAFTDTADFTAMSDTPLCIGNITHVTHIEVDENGTRAAAVTDVGMRCTALPMPPEHSVVLDRPFVYMILDTQTNLPIFLGVLNTL